MLPQSFCAKMKTLLGLEYDPFVQALELPRALGLRMNPRKAAPEQEKGLLEGPLAAFHLTPVPWCPSGFYYDPQTRPGLHPWHAAGVWYLQEPSAMAPAELLDPRPGERILDLCAAPGGKSTQIAGKMEGSGILVCNEINPKRAAVLASNVERMGIANALVLNEHPARLAQRFGEYFDRILVDAPCSGEGMFRKHDAAGADWSPETVAMCARRQAEILDSAAQMLRPGGRLVYSTCTFSPEENEGSVAAFLARHPDYSIEALDQTCFSPGRPKWADGDPALSRTFRLWPHCLRGEGHFAAVLRRRGEEARAQLPAAPSVRMPHAVSALLGELEIQIPAGIPVQFGERMFIAPAGTPSLQGLKVLRPGLELARSHTDLASPAHALALWCCKAASCHELQGDSPDCAAYLRGQTLATDARGWTLVRVDGMSLGWGKGAAGVLKNHYPKGLRIF